MLGQLAFERGHLLVQVLQSSSQRARRLGEGLGDERWLLELWSAQAFLDHHRSLIYAQLAPTAAQNGGDLVTRKPAAKPRRGRGEQPFHRPWIPDQLKSLRQPR